MSAEIIDGNKIAQDIREPEADELDIVLFGHPENVLSSFVVTAHRHRVSSRSALVIHHARLGGQNHSFDLRCPNALWAAASRATGTR